MRDSYNSYMSPIRLLPFADALGPNNMAADEVMLESAGECKIASLRFYTWSEPTLSLGYFQERTKSQAGPLPWVRRSTGGAAIVHHHELTYALALPAGKEWHSRESWICRFHHLIHDVLAETGIGSHLLLCGEEKKLGEVLCFLHQTPGDLLIDGSKVAGSAQRKRKGALLQHGSILLSRSEHAPMLAGINDLGKTNYRPLQLAEQLASRFNTETGNWTTEEIRRIPEIIEEKYANPTWNEKR
jgi:lipoate-protein ligase A